MKLLKPTAMSLVALAFVVPAFLPTGLFAQSKPTTTVEAAPAVVTSSNNSQKKEATPVRIVCLSTAPENFFRSKINQKGRSKEEVEQHEIILKKMEYARKISGFEAIFLRDGQSVAAKILRQLFPPVGEYFYLPLGSGFVVDSEKKYVVTNWHVADSCPQSEEFKTQLAILESSDHGALEFIRAELQTHKKVKSEDGKIVEVSYRYNKLLPKEDKYQGILQVICADKSLNCSIDTPSKVGFFAPDLALLKLNVGEGAGARSARTEPILLDRSYEKNVFSDKSAALLISGFPQVVIDATAALSPTRQATTAVTTSATYSNLQTFSNHMPGRSLRDQVETDMMLLSAQIHSGNSGGPVLLNNKIVGVVTSTITNISAAKRADSLTDSIELAKNAFVGAIPTGYGLAVNAKEIVELIDWFGIVKPASISIPILTTAASATLAAPPPVVCKSNETKVDGKCELVPAPFWKSPLILALLGLIAVAGGTFFWMVRGNKEKQPVPPVPNPIDDIPTRIHEPKPNPAPAPKPVMPAAVRLRGSHGNFNDKVFSIPTPNGVNALMVGRDPAVCQITFPNQLDTVSKRHCIFNWIQATRTFTVEDLGSTWGTFVNGKKIVKGEKITLKNGDTVDLAADKTNRFSVEIV